MSPALTADGVEIVHGMDLWVLSTARCVAVHVGKVSSWYAPTALSGNQIETACFSVAMSGGSVLLSGNLYSTRTAAISARLAELEAEAQRLRGMLEDGDG